MKELGLQELLRYALSGGVGIAALRLMYPNSTCLIGHMDDAGRVTLILGAILVLGTLIYNIHRALLFPPIFRLIGVIALPQTKSKWELLIQFWWWWRPTDVEIGVDRWRWKLGDKDRQRWDGWAAHTHFLYCSAWATLAAFEVGRYVAGPPDCRAGWIFWPLFLITLFAGLANNYRLLYSIAAERNREKEQFSALLK